ncbi:MAG: lipoyl synthase [Candidatus Brocadiales bacterium]
MKESVPSDGVATRLPPWLKKRVICGGSTGRVVQALDEFRLKTVCREALCPNIMECFARGTATFMVLGDSCTRTCGFCGVKKGGPKDPEEDEPERLSRAVKLVGLHHVVVTSVTRDDMPDGGSGHFSRVILALKRRKGLKIEVLVPDFRGVLDDVRKVLEAGPHIFAHNVETVPRLYPRVRPEACYKRSLRVLEFSNKECKNIRIKSGLMLGLGERKGEVFEVLRDLRRVGCEVVTIGQYLRPSKDQLPVERFLEPEEFEEYGEMARKLGFLEVFAGPFVRSSYCIV